jgi:hypothetical protein
MKKMMFSYAIVLATLFSCTEGNLAASDVPQAAKSSLESKYPGATDVEWKAEKEDGKKIYEAEFKWNGKEIEAEFDAEGTFIREEE